jgi:hypothetical protein
MAVTSSAATQLGRRRPCRVIGRVLRAWLGQRCTCAKKTKTRTRLSSKLLFDLLFTSASSQLAGSSNMEPTSAVFARRVCRTRRKAPVSNHGTNCTTPTAAQQPRSIFAFSRALTNLACHVVRVRVSARRMSIAFAWNDLAFLPPPLHLSRS